MHTILKGNFFIQFTLILLGYFVSNLTIAQEQDSTNILNGFTYRIVETLLYKNDQVDIHGISSMIRKKFYEMGVNIIGENEESWPNELQQNKCLLFRCDVTAPSRFVGRQKLSMKIINCRGEIVYEDFAFGNAETFDESFSRAVNNFFEKKLTLSPYTFDPSLTEQPSLNN